MSPNQSRITVLVIALANIILHLAVATNLEYHRDELLYFSQGYHLAWGYPSVPPLTAFIAAGVRTLLGSGVFAVKLLPALFSGVIVWLAAAIAGELGGKGYARVLAAVAVLVMPATLRTFHLFQPVYLDMTFWTLLTYLSLRSVNTQRETYWLLLGGVAGLALLNKYLVALYIVGLLVGLALTRHRKVFGQREIYFGGLIALLVFLPNLLWQIDHDFPVVGHMAALRESQLVNVDSFAFLSDQVLMSFSAVFLVLGGLIGLWRQERYRFLAIAATLVVVSLLVLRGKSYYTIGLFPSLAAAGAVGLEAMVRRYWLRIAVPVAMILLTLPLIPLGLPVCGPQGLVEYFQAVEANTGLTLGRTFEDGSIHDLPQDYADQIGWQELATETAAAYRQEPQPASTIIYCENYGHAGALTLIGGPLGLPDPICFGDAFNYWVPETLEPPVEVFYYINDDLGEDVAALFADIEVVGRIDEPLAREYGTTVYRCAEPRRPFAGFWEEVMERDPDPF